LHYRSGFLMPWLQSWMRSPGPQSDPDPISSKRRWKPIWMIRLICRSPWIDFAIQQMPLSLLRICEPRLGYDITFKKSVGKDLRKLDPTDADRLLRKLASELPEMADSLPELKGKYSGLRKYRVGDFRIIFAIIKGTIVITRIRHRRETYRD
jgi:mRNA interferase RelE/StbE